MTPALETNAIFIAFFLKVMHAGSHVHWVFFSLTERFIFEKEI